MGIKKAIFFTIDSLLASGIIILAVLLVSNFYLSEHQRTNINFASQDLIRVFSTLRVGDVGNEYVASLIASGEIEDSNNTILEQIGDFWADDKIQLAQDLIKNLTGEIVPSNYGLGIIVNEDIIYSRSVPVKKALISSRKIISGIAKAKPTQGYTSRVILSGIKSKKTSSYIYFGGYEGDGNLTKKIFLPNNVISINSSYLEVSAGGNFNLYINGVYSGTYVKDPSRDEMQADKWNISDAYLSNYKPGANNISINFTSDSSYIAGGFLRVTYITSSINDTQTPGLERYLFPGIEGVINLYSSIYAPNEPSNMNITLHFSSPYQIYLSLGNTTIYESNDTTEQIIIINNSNISGMISYSSLKQKTVPLRIALKNVSFISGTSKSDTVLITDRTGSMDACDVIVNCTAGLCDSNPSGGCHDRRDNVAIKSDKKFVDTILATQGNKIGLVGFGESLFPFCDFHDFSDNNVSLKYRISNYSNEWCGWTCISCSILAATELLAENEALSGLNEITDIDSTIGQLGDSPRPVSTTRTLEAGINRSKFVKSRLTIFGDSVSVGSGYRDCIYFNGNYIGRMCDINSLGWHTCSYPLKPEWFLSENNSISTWVQTTVSDFQNSTFSHVNLTISPGDVVLVNKSPSGYINYTTDSNGYIRNWLIAGPYLITQNLPQICSNHVCSIDNACNDTIGGEPVIEPYAGMWSNNKLWFTRNDPDDLIDLDAFLNPNEDVVAYAFAYVYSPVQQTVQIRDGSDDGIAIWLNGTLVFENMVNGACRGVGVDQDITTVTLNQGWNRLLVKVDEIWGGWSFRLRFTNTFGTPLSLTYATNNTIDLASTGSILSQVFDAGKTVEWLSVNWTEITPSKTNITLQVRTGNTPIPDSTWDNYNWNGPVYKISSGENITQVSGRYAQWLATLKTGNTSFVPILSDVAINFSADTKSNKVELTGGTTSGCFATSGTNDAWEFQEVKLSVWESPGSSVNLVYDTSSAEVQIGDAPFQQRATVSLSTNIDKSKARAALIEFEAIDVAPNYFDCVYVNGNYVGRVDYQKWNGTNVWQKIIFDVPVAFIKNGQNEVNFTSGTTSGCQRTSSDNDEWRFRNVNLSAVWTDEVISYNRPKSMLVMSDGEANTKIGDCPGCDSTGARAETIQKACEANDLYGVSIYTVAFGNVGSTAINTLNQSACCDNCSHFYTSNSSDELLNIYAQIAQSIVTTGFTAQSINISGGNISRTTLYPDSYIEFNYTPVDYYQNQIPLSFETERFGNNISTGNFIVYPNTTVSDAKVTSYSGTKWTDRSFANSQIVFNLSVYGNDYQVLGDPFTVNIPTGNIIQGNNSVIISTGLSPSNSTNGSVDDRAIYTLLVKGASDYSSVVANASGCSWNLTFEDETTSIVNVPGSYSGTSSCNFATKTYNPNDALDSSVFELFNHLDIDKDGKLDINVETNNLNFNTVTISKVPSLWGPAIIEVRIWE